MTRQLFRSQPNNDKHRFTEIFKKKNLILIFSIILNIIFIIGFLFIGYKFRARIYDKIASFSTYNVVMFGNSLTAGGKWNKELNRLDIKNSGVGNFTTSNFVWILNKAVIQFKPKICFIEVELMI